MAAAAGALVVTPYLVVNGGQGGSVAPVVTASVHCADVRCVFAITAPACVCALCAAALEYYKKAFDATVNEVMMADDGHRVMHASFKIGATVLVHWPRL